MYEQDNTERDMCVFVCTDVPIVSRYNCSSLHVQGTLRIWFIHIVYHMKRQARVTGMTLATSGGRRDVSQSQTGVAAAAAAAAVINFTHAMVLLVHYLTLLHL